MCVYAALKDFAGPGATVVASTVVVVATVFYQRKQLKIAREKLQLDLFDKRFAIYELCKQLIEHLSNQRDFETVDKQKVQKLLTTIDEGGFFFFGDRTVRFLNELRDLSSNFIRDLAERNNISPDDHQRFARNAAELNGHLTRFRDIGNQLPTYFSDELSLRDLGRS
jgi:hypothetical protein